HDPALGPDLDQDPRAERALSPPGGGLSTSAGVGLGWKPADPATLSLMEELRADGVDVDDELAKFEDHPNGDVKVTGAAREKKLRTWLRRAREYARKKRPKISRSMPVDDDDESTQTPPPPPPPPPPRIVATRWRYRAGANPFDDRSGIRDVFLDTGDGSNEK